MTPIVRNDSASQLSIIDLECGSQTESLRYQSKKLSELISTRTELHNLNPITPDPAEQILDEQESSGMRYWLTEVRTAKEHGGDYRNRLDSAMRAALGSLLTFSVLVFPHQQVLGAVWIGNIFMHSNIKDSLGASTTSVRGFATSILLTTAFSWPVAFFLQTLDTMEAAILLPFVVFVCSFFIMSCPQLTARNLMILVMYIIVATQVRDKTEWWEPLGWTATYMIGLTVAILMNLLPLPRANFALHTTHEQVSRLEKDLTMLLLQCKAYADNTATTPGISRAAVASIELLHTRISRTIKSLKTKLPAVKVELAWRCNSEAAKDLEEWILQVEKLLIPLKSLRSALVQRVLGEEYALYSPTLREAKAIIKEEIGPARDRMLDAMIASVAVCHAWADPSAPRSVLPDVSTELRASLAECRLAFQSGMEKAARKLESNPHTNIPIFAHLTRRMAAFNSLFNLGDSFLSYIETHNWEAEEVRSKYRTFGPCRCIIWCLEAFIQYVSPQWLWYKADSFRLAFKTSVGMFIAAFFVSVPYLWEIAAPFGVWPGLTIASVNLADTGSSFKKAANRLFGTLIAAAFALLVSDLFPGNQDYVKIPAIGFFTFAVIYLKEQTHAYMYTYAATSIGSMLYGSVKNDFNIAGYIPKRIELIFIGIVIFSLVELLLFPRSSRKMVESIGFQSFLSIRDYLKQATSCTHRMADYVYRTTSDPEFYANELLFDPINIFELDKLEACQKKLKEDKTKLKKELESALVEPHAGLSLPLDPEAFRGLVKELGDCELHASNLLKSFRQIASLCSEEGHPIREMNWPRVHTEFLKDALDKAEYACEWLKSAYPDGRLRPQRGNSVKAVTAAAAFRGFEEVRLRTISSWSDSCSKEKGAAIMPVAITTTYFLELCHHIQKAGRHVETITYHFPAAK